MTDKNIEELRKAVRETVSREDVKYVICYGNGSYASRTKPVLIHSVEDVEKIIWSPLCVNNLTVFLKHAEKLPVPRGQEPDTRKVGVVVKGCDMRALNQLMQELTVERNDIIIIGMACEQTVDPGLIEQELLSKGIGLDSNLNIHWNNGSIIVENMDKSEEKIEIEMNAYLMDKCRRCEQPTPEDTDIIIGERIDAYGKDNYEDIENLNNMSLEEREGYWDNQFDKCIKCYACRNICPICVCKTCVLDSLKPQWVERGTEFDRKKQYHLMRAYCMLGRCIDCGECERACPANIPLTKLYRAGEKTIKDIFNYLPGRNRTDKPIFTRYDMDDTGGTIW